MRQRNAPAMLEDQIQEGIHRMQAAAFHADLAERLPDHRGVRTVDDLGVEEVPVPHPHTELRLVVLAEPPPVLLVPQEVVALHLVTQMQCGGPGTELLEDHQVDAVGVDLERHRQMLPAKIAAEALHRSRRRAHDPDRVRIALDVGGRQQAGLELAAEQAHRLRQLRSQVQRILNIGTGLQDPAAAAQHRLEPAQLARLGVGGRQGARSAGVTVELVEKQLLGGHSDEPGVDRLAEHPLHLGLLGLRSGRSSLRVARSNPIVAVRISEWPMKAARLGPKGSDSSAATYSLQFDQVLFWSTAAMTCSRGIASTRPNRSPASTPPMWMVDSEHDPSMTVVTPWRTDSASDGATEHLDVVVGVDVDHARQHPPARRVDDLRAVRGVEFVGGDGGDVPVADTDVADRRRRTGAVEPAAVADDRVVAHKRQ